VQLVVGRVGRPHGVRGEVLVDPRTDRPDNWFAAGVVLATDPAGRGPLTVTAARWHHDRLLVRFAGVIDRVGAGELRGTTLLGDVDEGERSADPDEFYDHQLVGLEVVVVADGRVVGTVADVIHLPGQDLLSVRRATGEEVLVPFVAAIVPLVDVDAGRLMVDPPGGLLDDIGGR
jgi:16S rRNA processing protein RimM